MCIVFQQPASFIEADRRILSESFDVTTFEYHRKRNLPRLARTILESDISYCWFALGHATAAVALSRWFRKRSVVVVGGWDVVALPEIPYGAMLSPTRRRKTSWTLRRADLVLAVSEANRQDAARWVSRDILTVPLGVDLERFRPAGAKSQEVITVASVSHAQAVAKKGVNVFLEAARRMPETPFVLIGQIAPDVGRRIRADAPPNVTLTGWVDDDTLLRFYQRAAVYVQLSAHESFGLAMAEAMACQCTPVVSDRGALAEVVGTAGIVVPYGDSDAAAQAIREALRANGTRARQRVVDEYPLSRRRGRLLALMEALR